MGWGSAGDIFDPVARSLIACDASDLIKREVLGQLIKQLQDGDWDTADESLEQFRDDPIIVELFHKAGVGVEDYSGWVEGRLDWLPDVGSWELRCGGQHGSLAVEDGTAEGHDRLVHLWALHDQEHHGGNGQTRTGMLINRNSETKPR